MQEIYKKFDLNGKMALVTGGGEGIGRALALGLAEAGADLVLCGRKREKLLAVKEEIAQLGRRAETYALDLRRVAEIAEFKTFVEKGVGRLDILVNNAGYVVTSPAREVSEEDWDTMVDTGLKGLFFCCQAFGELMRRRGYGKIINLGSTFSRSIVPGRAVYGAVKAGLAHLTEALALEWAPDGIRVNCLAPTAVMTPSRAETLQGELLERVLARIPLGRLATPDDLLGAAIFLASQASDFVTGQTIFVDGGWLAGS